MGIQATGLLRGVTGTRTPRVFENASDVLGKYLICSVIQTPSATPPPEKKTPLSGVASALKGVEFIAQHIRKADKDTEVSGMEWKDGMVGIRGLSFKDA